MIRLRSLIAALALGLSTTAWAELKTYDVEPQFQQEIFSALNNILNSSAPGVVNGASYGRVQLLPSGQLLVNADPETHKQVEQVLQAIGKRATPVAPRVELRYWAVLGSRVAAANPPGTPTPDALGPVLAELIRVHEALAFRVIGTATVATDSGQNGQVDGTTMDVSQRVFVQGEYLNARINMNLRSIGQLGTPDANVRGQVEVQTTLRRGEFVVLGQSELVGGGLDGPVFFIVHWPDAQGR